VCGRFEYSSFLVVFLGCYMTDVVSGCVVLGIGPYVGSVFMNKGRF
jgi:hypothetical protein